ncbi:MAG: ABC transporter permease [Micrococcales bacterium]|nr:ABC transporter permease [Micrococcales bacterium]
MTAAIVSEIRKTRSTRAWWILLLAMAGYLVLTAVLMTLAMHYGGDGEEGAPLASLGGIANLVYAVAQGIAYPFAVMIGALTVTTEFRHKTLTWTFLAEPRRGRVLAAKMAAGVPLGLVYGVVAVGSTVAAGAVTLAIVNEPTSLDAAATWAMLGREVLALVIWTLVGVGFGALLRNQVIAIVALLVFTQFIEPLLRTLPLMLEQKWTWVKFLPGAAGDGIAGKSFFSIMGAGSTVDSLSTPWAAITLLAYAAVLGAAGYFTSFSRDVT